MIGTGFLVLAACRGQIYWMALFHCGFMKTLFAYHALINLSGSSTANWMIVQQKTNANPNSEVI